MSVSPVDPLWRATDRELIRQYADWPATEASLDMITEQMNVVARHSPPTVTSVQGWMDEVEELEEGQAGAIADGTAFLGDVQEYEGLRPGLKPTRKDMLSAADSLKWDVETLTKVRIKTGPAGGQGTQSGMIAARIGTLKRRILNALVILTDSGYGSTMLDRS